MDADRLDRMEKKLDMIIEHFNIGASSPARRSIKEIEALVNEKIFHLQVHRKKAKKQPCQSAN